MEEKPKRGIDTAGRWVLLATICASSMAFLDGSALNVVLSTIQDDLGASAGDLLWIVNAYALCLGANASTALALFYLPFLPFFVGLPRLLLG
jgi:hypothetical protein